jgi:hypothetical protein
VTLSRSCAQVPAKSWFCCSNSWSRFGVTYVVLVSFFSFTNVLLVSLALRTVCFVSTVRSFLPWISSARFVISAPRVCFVPRIFVLAACSLVFSPTGLRFGRPVFISRSQDPLPTAFLAGLLRRIFSRRPKPRVSCS